MHRKSNFLKQETFMVAIKCIKHPGINLPKNLQDLYGDFYEILKYIKEDLTRTIHILIERFNVIKMLILPNLWILYNSFKISTR